jgi:hypothetical protein
MKDLDFKKISLQIAEASQKENFNLFRFVEEINKNKP